MLRQSVFLFALTLLLSGCGGSGSEQTTLPQIGAPITQSAAVHTLAVGSQSAAAGSAIDAGGPSSGKFVADEDYHGGHLATPTSDTVDTSHVANPAPQTVYQTGRRGSAFSYSIGGLTPSATYSVRLHFAENYWSNAGARRFNVTSSGTTLLDNFDIFAAAGGEHIAVIKEFSLKAGADGTLSLSFAATVDRALVAGIEVTGSASPPATFNDWSTYGYDNLRDGFNPNSGTLTPASVARLHLAWQSTVNRQTERSGSQTQPILVTNVGGHAGMLIVGGVNGDYYAFDAVSGAQVWHTPSYGNEQYTCSYAPGSFYVGVGGTAAYDHNTRAFYITGNSNSAALGPAQNTLYRFDAATGTRLGSVDLTPDLISHEVDFAHTAVTIGRGGTLYAGIGSTCDVPNTRGRVVAVDPTSMKVASTFFTAWGRGGNYVGAGVWGWGGVSIDSTGELYTTVANTYDSRNAASITAPASTGSGEQTGYGENMLALTPELELSAANAPGFQIGAGGSDDLDFTGSPVLFRPLGCDQFAAAQGKAGQLLMYDTQRIGSGPLARYQFSKPFYSAAYLGNPTYSPATGLLYANVDSAQGGSLRPPGLVAVAPSGCGGFTILWNAAFGPDSFGYTPATTRGAPTVSAGGVVFTSSPCTSNGSGSCGAPGGTAAGAVWAIDASSGTVLNAGKPVLITRGQMRMPPVVDGDWVYVYDNDGDLYGLTIGAGSELRNALPSQPASEPRNMNVPSQ